MSVLPPLREELLLHPGSITRQGAPTWLLQDPGRNLFFRIDWLTFEFLLRWHLDDSEAILSAIAQETPLQPDEDDLAAVFHFLADNELIQRHADSAWFWRKNLERRSSWWHWLLHHYLFFRIPIWHPDEWLNRTLPWIQVFYTKTFFLLTLSALLIGLIEVSRQWDSFLTSFFDTFTVWGIANYFLAIIFVKWLHELGHAWTAKRYGCRVPIMGIAFLVMFPMAYTDVNEAWKLRDRYRRLHVGMAGVLVELTVAAWATLAWSFLPNGRLQDIAFLLATTTWISTLAINLSPFMRFDGYFVLMDWLDMPNLHTRVFALARWRLRELLFGLGLSPPEFFPKDRQFALLSFALAIWVYRLVVFSSIALMVYHFFPKPLGPLLAAIEFGWFIVLPILSEINIWVKIRLMILRSYRTWLTLAVLGTILVVLVIPWDRRIYSQGLLQPAQYLFIVAPEAAQVSLLPVGDGSLVSQNEELIHLDSPLLAYQQNVVKTQIANLRWLVETAGVDTQLREKQLVLKEELGKAQAELIGIEQNFSRYRPSAPFPGHFYWMDPNLRIGNWVAKDERLGVLSNTSEWLVETYLTEQNLHRLVIGDVGKFYSQTPDVVQLQLWVKDINYDAVHVLPEGILSSTHGGELPARDTAYGTVPEVSIYRVSLTLQTPYRPAAPRILPGHVVLLGEPKNFLAEFIHFIIALFVREAGF